MLLDAARIDTCIDTCIDRGQAHREQAPALHDATLDVTLRPSPSLRIISATVHALAIGIVFALALGRPVLWAALPILVWQGVRGDARLRLAGRGVCTRFRWSADQHVQWVENSRPPRDGFCVNADCWGALWVRLTFAGPSRGRSRRLIIPRDAVDSETHRRLRARTRVVPPPAEP